MGDVVGAVFAVSMTAICAGEFQLQPVGADPDHRDPGRAWEAFRGCLRGVLVVVLPELLRGVALFRLLVFGVLMVVFMIVRPQGMWPGEYPGRVVTIGREAEKRHDGGASLSLGGGKE